MAQNVSTLQDQVKNYEKVKKEKEEALRKLESSESVWETLKKEHEEVLGKYESEIREIKRNFEDFQNRMKQIRDLSNTQAVPQVVPQIAPGIQLPTFQQHGQPQISGIQFATFQPQPPMNHQPLFDFTTNILQPMNLSDNSMGFTSSETASDQETVDVNEMTIDIESIRSISRSTLKLLLESSRQKEVHEVFKSFFKLKSAKADKKKFREEIGEYIRKNYLNEELVRFCRTCFQFYQNRIEMCVYNVSKMKRKPTGCKQCGKKLSLWIFSDVDGNADFYSINTINSKKKIQKKIKEEKDRTEDIIATPSMQQKRGIDEVSGNNEFEPELKKSETE